MNKGMQSHHHGINTMSLLYDYHWSMELLVKVKNQLELSVHYLRDHLKEEKCACGDIEEDVEFYTLLLEEINKAIESKDYSAVPWIQEQLHSYVSERYSVHPCISWLLNVHHLWVFDAKL
ncbi:hypothetical protein [Ammoniphilus sp. YIM 78166]|uniref:hypothetical protein n=1 Tax=Ammoniphilus sp. YIM 78166 TaxID=1644106 RepID=UPI00106F11F9|nr:hypothetical protein [Ammoniphilus sp. YIM 78166]